MEEKQVYKCAYCGAEYDTPAARGRCEMECDMKRQREAERDRRKRLDQERDKRWSEVVAAGERYKELSRQFFNDYPGGTWKAPTSVWDLLLSL